jgi:hypothetical protein
MFAYSSRTATPIRTKLGMLIPLDQKEISERSELRKDVLSAGPGEGGSCISTTKQDKKNGAKARVVCFGRDKGHNPKKLSSVRVTVKIFVLRSTVYLK